MKKKTVPRRITGRCIDPELHEMRPCDCPGVPRFISDTERLDKLIEMIRPQWVIGRPEIDAAIRAREILR